MKLCDLLQELEEFNICGNVDVEITKVCHNSREVEKGSLFVCIRGSGFDGHDFLDAVVEVHSPGY